MNNCSVRFQLDSGAQINTIQKFVRKEQIRLSSSTLCIWLSTYETLGKADIQFTNPKSNEMIYIIFAVVSNKRLLGLQVIQNMNLTTDEKFILMVDTISDFGEATLDVEDEVQPNILPCRKLPLFIKDRVKTERDK